MMSIQNQFNTARISVSVCFSSLSKLLEEGGIIHADDELEQEIADVLNDMLFLLQTAQHIAERTRKKIIDVV